MKPKHFTKLKGTALYVHVPFCMSICSYCDFSKLFYNQKWVESYLKALAVEIEQANIETLISTIYIGGGTPTSLDEQQLEQLLKILAPYSHHLIEYTIEINPETMTIAKLKLLKNYGVSRLSIGVQTFNEKILSLINRRHCNQQVFDLIDRAHHLGFEDISIDLMYNLPNQTFKDVQDDLTIVASLAIQHISYYSLILEEHTVLYHSNYEPMDEEVEYQCSIYIQETLHQLGFERYEISNYALKGHQSMHNLVYWHNLPYYGFGLGAHGFINDVRYYNTRKLSDYNCFKFRLGQDTLSLEEQKFEGIMLGLRLVQGIDIEQFNQRYRCDLLEEFKVEIERYIKKDMLVINQGFLTTTPLGMDLLHVILIDFMQE